MRSGIFYGFLRGCFPEITSGIEPWIIAEMFLGFPCGVLSSIFPDFFFGIIPNSEFKKSYSLFIGILSGISVENLTAIPTSILPGLFLRKSFRDFSRNSFRDSIRNAYGTSMLFTIRMNFFNFRTKKSFASFPWLV